MKVRKLLVAVVIILLITNIPYAIGWIMQGSDYVFGGFLLNPVDGNTYLAKMNQGASGSWLFTLPYTVQAGKGVFLFEFYLFLGHLSAWTGLSQIVVFHLARIISQIFLIVALYQFCLQITDGKRELAERSFFLALLGSGFGWLGLIFGLLTIDLWVPEAYPFLSMYAAPHFSLGLACLLSILTLFLRESSWIINAQAVIYGAILGLVMPFGIVIVFIIMFAVVVWEWIQAKYLDFMNLFSSMILGGPLILIQYWQTIQNPILMKWNEQNITPSPALWDLILSFSPAVVLACFGLAAIWKDRKKKNAKLLIVWIISGLLLIYLPISLQRRFIFGLFIPSAVLAVYGIHSWLNSPAKRKWVWITALMITLPTNLLVLLIGLYGVQSHDPLYFLSRDENSALQWIAINTDSQNVILASPEIGLFIPAHTGRRVVYGHPFETVNAEYEEKQVTDFFSNALSRDDEEKMLKDDQIDYIFWGPREKSFGTPEILQELEPVYQNQEVAIYSLIGN